MSLRYLMIEPTTACDLRCLSCPIRDIAGDVTWADAYADGGVSFLAWDGIRRAKQHAADYVGRVLNASADGALDRRSPLAAVLRRGRIRPSRGGTPPIEVLKRVVSEAGPGIERIDLFNYGEPFLYRPCSTHSGTSVARSRPPRSSSRPTGCRCGPGSSRRSRRAAARLDRVLGRRLRRAELPPVPRSQTLRGGVGDHAALPRTRAPHGHARRLTIRRIPLERQRRAAAARDRARRAGRHSTLVRLLVHVGAIAAPSERPRLPSLVRAPIHRSSRRTPTGGW